ncbi:hypothetical protein HKX48_006083 [Thoreauomyces humboldtii]|nr:hypothetical protein HKX48_006083 [Thoreauomyces humboldtii]
MPSSCASTNVAEENAQGNLSMVFRSMVDISDTIRGTDCLNLAAGLVEFPPPRTLQELGAQVLLREEVSELSVNKNPCIYRARGGDNIFVKAVQRLESDVYGTGEYSPDMILATSGAAGAYAAVIAAIRSLKKLGRRPPRIGLLDPFYSYHRDTVLSMSGDDTEIVFVPAKSDFSLDLDLLEEAAASLDLLVITNPGNPSCHVLTADEVEALDRLAKAHPHMYIFSDEVHTTSSPPFPLTNPLSYSTYIDDQVYCDMLHDATFNSFSSTRSANIVVARSFSKSLSVGSWRIGYLTGHPQFLVSVAEAHDRLFLGANVLQMAVGQYIVDHFHDFMEHRQMLNKVLQVNAAMIRTALEESLGWTYLPSGGSMYRLIRHNCTSDREAFDLLMNLGVAVVPGNLLSTANSTGFLRMHLAYPQKKAAEVCRRLRKGIPGRRRSLAQIADVLL